MKQTILILFAAGLIAGCATTHETMSEGQDEKNEISQIASLSDMEYAAYFRGDIATLRKLEADDLVVFADGKAETTKGRYEGVESKAKAGQWFPTPVELTTEKRDTRLFGNSAIAYGIVSEKQRDDVARVAYTEAWAKRDGRWQMVYLSYNILK